MQDLVIIGAGAAGLSASIYASRYQINQFIIGKITGGQVNEAHLIENYLGIESITGAELAERFRHHAESYGVKITHDEVVGIETTNGDYVVKTASGRNHKTKTVILAMGAKHRHLGVPGETDFIGRGVSYCSICDAPLYKGKTVAVIGGGDSAISAAVHLADIAEKVYLIARGTLRAEPIWVDELKKKPNTSAIMNTKILEMKGVNKLEKLILDRPYEGKEELEVDGVFVEVGLIPAVGITNNIGVQLDEAGNIRITPNGETNVPGVFAAGDLAAIAGMMNFRQIITSAAEGAIAAASVYKYLKTQSPAPSWGAGQAPPVGEEPHATHAP